MKRLFAIALAILLSVATLSSCAATFSGSSKTNGQITEPPGSSGVQDTTDGETDLPGETTGTETAPAQTGDGYSKNY